MCQKGFVMKRQWPVGKRKILNICLAVCSNVTKYPSGWSVSGGRFKPETVQILITLVRQYENGSMRQCMTVWRFFGLFKIKESGGTATSLNTAMNRWVP